MIDEVAVKTFRNALKAIREQGGRIIYGGDILDGYPSELYVRPALAEVENHWPIVQEETFAPLLYLIRCQDFDEALRLQNDVPQGLSSAVFTRDFQESEKFLSHEGSDCGLANVKHRNFRSRNRRGVRRGKKIPEEGVNPDQMPGKPTCAVKPTLSTTLPTCRWHKVLILIWVNNQNLQTKTIKTALI